MFDYRKHRWIIPLVISLSILIADQISKIWIVAELGPEPALRYKTIIGDWFRFVYSQNTGIAFNFFSDMSPVFIITSVLISALVIYGYIAHLPNHSVFVQSSIGLILGGAMGNTFDRIRVGFVIDFIQVGWWPVFNVADSAITTGAIVLAIYLLVVGDERDVPRSAPPRDDVLLYELLEQGVDKHHKKQHSQRDV